MGTDKVVLIVDDDRAVLETMRLLLEGKGGYAVHCAIGTVGAAGYLASDRRIDVLIADVILAGEKTGIDVCQQALDQRPALALVVISADPNVAEETVPERAVYLRKPFGGHELIGAIAQALDAVQAAEDAG